MPPTSLTKVTASSFADGVADVGYEAADQPNGNDFVNTGKTILLVDNASGGNVTPTFAVGASKFTVNDAITKTPNTPVAAAKVGFYGPFPTAIYGSTVTVNYDVGASITVAVVELEQTPL
ncbi:hypothetical protein LCGC14_0424560 [marine sediment metagenome]|uniref:Uncharacterized protein n=1 Tax=marine sediment metagenome TaxID=412755 RepID=A0A0F9SVX1_9ZZZZ